MGLASDHAAGDTPFDADVALEPPLDGGAGHHAGRPQAEDPEKHSPPDRRSVAPATLHHAENRHLVRVAAGTATRRAPIYSATPRLGR